MPPALPSARAPSLDRAPAARPAGLDALRAERTLRFRRPLLALSAFIAVGFVVRSLSLWAAKSTFEAERAAQDVRGEEAAAASARRRRAAAVDYDRVMARVLRLEAALAEEEAAARARAAPLA